MQKATKNAPKSARKVTFEFVNGANGMELKSTTNATNVPENATGAQIEKAKRKLSSLMSAKIEANKEHKAEIYGFNFNLNSFKTKGTKYLAEFNAKHNLSIKMAKVMELKAENLTPFMTERQKEQKANNGNKWSFWDIETLVAKYFAPQKVQKIKAKK